MVEKNFNVQMEIVFEKLIYVMVTMTVETVLGPMNKVAGDLSFLLF